MADPPEPPSVPFPGLGSALARLRRRQGRTQVAVAEAAGLARSQLSAYECGRYPPSLSSLAHLLDALGSDLGDLQAALLGEASQLDRPAAGESTAIREWSLQGTGVRISEREMLELACLLLRFLGEGARHRSPTE